MSQEASTAPVSAAAPPFRAIPELVHEHAVSRPQAVALQQGGRQCSWQDLDRLMDRVAAGLQRDGLQPADVVALCAANSIEGAAVFLGALRAGVTVAPLSTRSLPDPLAGMAADCGARLLFADREAPEFQGPRRIALAGAGGGQGLLEWLAPPDARPAPVQTEPSWPFNIIYSSGTTGEPKGIVHSHAMRWLHVARADSHGYGPDAVTLVSTSLCSNTSLVSFLPALARGGKVVFFEGRFDPACWLALAQQVRATHAMLVPVQYQRLMALPDFGRYDLSSFRMKFCTSAHFPAALKADVLARWPGGLVESYGMTEGGGTCMLEAHRHPDKLHTVGRPREGHDIRLIDEAGQELPPGGVGEIVGHSAATMLGYHGRPDLTREAEWHDALGRRFIRTGDIGRFDEDGFLILLDRRKDMVVTGGFNVYPSDLEAVLRGHPAVAEAAVIGVPSAEWGESPVAYVVARPGAPAAAALRDWANERLSGIQRLADLRCIPELPRSEVGKVLKRELRQRWAAGG